MRATRYILIALAAALAAGCGKTSREEAGSGLHAVSVTLEAGGAAVKGDDGWESRIDPLDSHVLVYDDAGRLESSATGFTLGTDGFWHSPDVYMKTGRKTVFVLLNASLPEGRETLDGLMDCRVMLGNVRSAGVPMSGMAEAYIEGESRLLVKVTRLLCKLTVTTLTRNFTEGRYADDPLTVTSIRLGNAAGDVVLSRSEEDTPATWYNRLGVDDAPPAVVPLICLQNMDTDVPEGRTVELSHDFYCMPNPVAVDSFGGEWTPRRTRLVVEARMRGVTCYYPLTLTDLRPNRHYTASVTLTRPGSDDPDIPDREVDVPVDAYLEVSVADWTDEFVTAGGN